MRRHVFIDTTLVHPALSRASIDLLGAGNLVTGSDFPITGEKLMRDLLIKAMKQARLSAMSRTRSPHAIVCGCWA
jgi:hypothetical protein